MKKCTITITETKDIDIEPGGMTPFEIVTALDALINIMCQQATGDYQKGQQMKNFCADKNFEVQRNAPLLPGF